MARFGKKENLVTDAPVESGAWRTAIDQFNQGTTAGFADEMIDPIAAGAAWLAGDGNYSDLYDQAREMSKNDLLAQHEQHPLLSAGANIGGAVTGGYLGGKMLSALAPEAVNAAKTYAELNPYKAAALTGGGGSSLFAAGQTEGDVGDRATSAALHFVPGMVGGVAGYKLAQLGSSALRSPTLQKFIGDETSGAGGSMRGMLDDPITETPAAMTPMSAAGILDEPGLARLEQGKTVIPLTMGDLTQKGDIQRAEQRAYELGSQPIRDAREIQKQAMQRPLINTLGEGQALDDTSLALRAQDQAIKAADLLRKQYDSLGGQVTAAYKYARETGEGVGIDADAVQKGFLDTVKTNLAASGYKIGQVPNLEEKISDLENIMNPEGKGATVTSVTLKHLEDWKKEFNQGNFASDKISTPTVNMHVKMIGRAYDDFLTNLADTSIVNGDQTAIEAFKNARGLAAQKFKFYDSDKTIQRILDDRDLSGQQLVNSIWGLNKITGKGDNGNIVGKFIALAGDKSSEMQEAIKQGVIAKVLNDGMNAHNNAGKSVFDMAAGINSSLKNLMKSRETFESIFSDTEQQYFKEYSKAIGSIAQKEVGAINRSGNASAIIQAATHIGNFALHLIPGGSATAGIIKMGMEKKAASEIIGKAEEGLDDFIAKALQKVDAASVFYGGYAGGAAVDPVGGAIKQSVQGDQNDNNGN